MDSDCPVSLWASHQHPDFRLTQVQIEQNILSKEKCSSNLSSSNAPTQNFMYSSNMQLMLKARDQTLWMSFLSTALLVIQRWSISTATHAERGLLQCFAYFIIILLDSLQSTSVLHTAIWRQVPSLEPRTYDAAVLALWKYRQPQLKPQES
jgi:hypothetical protein